MTTQVVPASCLADCTTPGGRVTTGRPNGPGDRTGGSAPRSARRRLVSLGADLGQQALRGRLVPYDPVGSVMARLPLVDDALELPSRLVVSPLGDETPGQLDACAREVRVEERAPSADPSARGTSPPNIRASRGRRTPPAPTPGRGWGRGSKDGCGSPASGSTGETRRAAFPFVIAQRPRFAAYQRWASGLRGAMSMACGDVAPAAYRSSRAKKPTSGAR